MQAVAVTITNPVSGFTRTATTDATGRYVFNNLPPNPYHLAVTAQGFQTLERDVDVRTGVPITMDLTLALAGATSSVEVVGHNEDLLERRSDSPHGCRSNAHCEAAHRVIRPAGSIRS